MVVKATSTMTQKISNFFGNLFFLLYLVLSIPALIFIPPLGAFAADADIPAGGVFLCVLVLAIIPLSMPVSIYFICARSVDRRYGKMFFFCLFPLLCCIFAFAAIFLIIYTHTTCF